MFGQRNDGVKGFVLVDGREVGETLQCVHCGKHWMVQKGSGKRRGFCTGCVGPTCGSAACARCVPLEAKFEYVEATAERKSSVISRLLGRYPDLPLLPL